MGIPTYCRSSPSPLLFNRRRDRERDDGRNRHELDEEHHRIDVEGVRKRGGCGSQ